MDKIWDRKSFKVGGHWQFFVQSSIFSYCSNVTLYYLEIPDEIWFCVISVKLVIKQQPVSLALDSLSTLP